MEIYSIGFTQTTARHFFDRLRTAGIRRLLDVRLNNSSQLAGFAKARDLSYFLDNLVGASYEHQPILAPTQELLDAYKKDSLPWDEYERRFLGLMAEREVESVLDRSDFEDATVLLCSEATAERCHRRLVCEYLAEYWLDLKANHL
jgi:uncharacterized protein (DUF488 family)